MTAGAVNDGVGSKEPIKIMANIFISFLGAGILGLPYAYKEAGILEGVAIMLFVGLCSVKAMLLVIDCKHKLIAKTPPKPFGNGTVKSSAKYGNGSKIEMEDLLPDGGQSVQIEDPSLPAAPGQNLTYGDVGYYAIGNLGRIIVDVVIVVSQVGFCCAYLIFICENLSAYFSALKLIHWLLLLLPPLYGLTLLRHLSSLAVSSLFAQLSNLLAFAVVFWFDFEHFYQIERIHPREISLEGFPFFLAVAIYCYEGAGMILSLEGSLHEEIRHQFKGYFKLTMGIVTFLYISFGVCGYLSFGPDTNAIITLNLPKGSALDFSMMVKSCLCLALFFTYPVMMFPVINIIETKLIPNAKENLMKGNILRLVMVIITGLIVLAVPNFANLMALVGASCCTLIAFVLPAVFHMKIFKGALTKWQFSIDTFLIVLGVLGGIVGTWDALVRLHETHTGGEQVFVYNTTAMPFLNTTVIDPKWISALPTPNPVLSNMNNVTSQLQTNSTVATSARIANTTLLNAVKQLSSSITKQQQTTTTSASILEQLGITKGS